LNSLLLLLLSLRVLLLRLVIPTYPIHESSSDVKKDRYRDAEQDKEHGLSKLVSLTPVSSTEGPLKVILRAEIALSFTLSISAFPRPLKNNGLGRQI
jgi:hypothetical protein